MNQKPIYAVVGDIGSAKELLPAMQFFPKDDVEWFCDAGSKAKAGTDVLEKARVPYLIRDPQENDYPKVIVIGTSATAVDAQIAWTRYGVENNIPVLWLEDLWGTGERPSVSSVWPHEMLVIDEMAEQIARTVRPGLKTRVVGKHTFAQYAELLKNRDAIRERVRNELGVKHTFLITVGFGGDPAKRAWDQLTQILENFSRCTIREFVFAWRFHPKHPEKDKLWECATLSGLPYVDARGIDMDELNLASDLVAANWGNTDPYKALVAGVPVVTMLFPYDTDVRMAAGYPDGVPPIVMTSREWGAESVNDLETLVWKTMAANSRKLREWTKIVRGAPFVPLLEPGAPERVVAAIKEYL